MDNKSVNWTILSTYGFVSGMPVMCSMSFKCAKENFTDHVYRAYSQMGNEKGISKKYGKTEWGICQCL